MKSSILALLVGLFVTAVASQALAQSVPGPDPGGRAPGMSPSVVQDTAQRDAAIGRCVRQAHTQYPTDDADGGRGRTSVYKACMTTAGFTP